MINLHDPKGNRVNIPEPGHGDSYFGGKCGNANQLGDVDENPGESCLFFLSGTRIHGKGSP